MRNRILFIVSGAGLALALLSAYLFSRQPTAQPPLFPPAANPYAQGIYANGIVESADPAGQNINLFPEVAGPITQVLVSEGQHVRAGEPLLAIDDSVQRATAGQLQAQAAAAQATLRELKAQPRRENLAVAAAQVDAARATLRNAADQLAKIERAYAADPRSISTDTLDNARNAAKIAATSLGVVERQYDLTKAGAWVYDIENAAQNYAALEKSAQSAAALLAKYTVRAPVDGEVLAVRTGVGSFVSPQGAYDSYTQGYAPLVVMSRPQQRLQVRAYIDEILIHQLPPPGRIKAEMYVRGTTEHLPLAFVRVQPYVSPKIELSDQREERVDLRVLPVIFSVEPRAGLALYPGQLVDVYVGAK